MRNINVELNNIFNGLCGQLYRLWLSEHNFLDFLLSFITFRKKVMKNNQPAAEEVNLILPAYDIAFYFMPLFCTSQTPESHHPFLLFLQSVPQSSIYLS